MNVQLKKGGNASQKDIVALEQKIGEPIVPEFTAFVAGNDGAEPESNTFDIGETNDSGVNQFIPVKDIPNEMQYIENLPPRSFPIAWAEGGNYVFINQSEGGAVFFWDHELPDDIAKLADNFQGFLDLLEPFDINSVELKPGEVRNAWIDPDLLKELED